MNEPAGEKETRGTRRGAAGALRLHARAYAAGSLVFFLVGLSAGAPWWFFWPVLGWGAIVFAHYMYAKSTGIDDEWAARRADKLAHRAYDVGHIEDIRHRYEGAPDTGCGAARRGARGGAAPDEPPGRDLG